MCNSKELREIPGGLDALSQQVHRELKILSWPGKPWTRTVEVMGAAAPAGAHVHDTIIVGGGQCGLAVAFGLLRERVTNVLILDENEEGKEGPWVTYARMVTLRTPKHLTGIDFGMACLTFQAYYEARYGCDAWEALDKIPKEQWMQYLVWYRTVLQLPVRNGLRVEGIESATSGGTADSATLYHVRVSDRATGGLTQLYARKVVLATGIQGGGEWHVPHFIQEAVPPHLYGHTSRMIDFDALKGKRVAILGGGASAFDNAQHALARGVGEVHTFVRRPELPRVNPIRFMEQAGFLKHFADLPDATKYLGIDFFLGFNQPPTNDTFSRACSYPNFQLHLGAPWEKLEVVANGSQVRITTPKGDAGPFDFLIVSTGLLTNCALRPELATLAPYIATWADRFSDAAAAAGGVTKRNSLIDAHPYLGPAFEFLEKVPGSATHLRGIFAYNYSALCSLGLSASALSGVKFALPKLISGITRQLFLEDAPAIVGDYLAYNEEEFKGVWPSVTPNGATANATTAATATAGASANSSCCTPAQAVPEGACSVAVAQ